MRKSIKTLIIAVSAVLVVAIALSVVCLNYHRIFIISQNIGVGKDKNPLEICSPETDEINLNDIDKYEYIDLNQSLMLVNTEYTVDENYPWSISEYKDTTVYMNDCMKDAYARLSQAVTDKTGKKLYVSSDVRDRDEQEALYEKDPNTATVPGASEHETGLCVDVYVAGFGGDAFLKSKAGRFVNSHAHEYGFIIRYPSYGEDITGIRFEPWHIRYVGDGVADYIYNNNLTLEEFVCNLEVGKFYSYGEYIFSRQRCEEPIKVPQNAKKCTVSLDNTGYYIIVSQMK